MHKLAKLDQAHVWHPFTQMRDWLKREPIVIVEGKGALLRDVNGREYLDANSSIWTSLHGHNHPGINSAIQKQLKKIAHSSALGLANEPASLLAAELVKEANRIYDLRFTIYDRKTKTTRQSEFVNRKLERVFFSDDGSTAMEVALKLAYEFTRRIRGKKSRPKFLSLKGGYHGDTVGAVALGHIDLFHNAYRDLLFKTDEAMSPYCYRCPFNKARPERADAREYRKCNWECVDQVEVRFVARKKRGNPYAAFVFEPLMQGAAGMIPQPSGWLQRVSDIARSHRALLVADEVMTGFGRANSTFKVQDSRLPIFACHEEGVRPDFLCVAKGLTGGYLPMAATLTTQTIFDAFLGEYSEFKTFFHGHSYTANQLGAAAALANLDILQTPHSVRTRATLQQTLAHELKQLWALPNIGDIRQVGSIAGIELVKDWRTRKPLTCENRPAFAFAMPWPDAAF
jgi:adenosylmethionine-8-amino-7-oxononanoate aminotransferase